MYRKVDEVEGLVSSLLESAGAVSHFFCFRKGGFSKGEFSSLNMSFHVGDEEGNVRRNRDLICRLFHLDRLITLKQIHGSRVVVVKGVEDEKEGDGLITDLKGVALGILTADCIPVLVLSPERKVIGAFHGGWRGLVKGIIRKGIKKMEEVYGVKREGLIVAIGPHIRDCCYRVGRDALELIKERYDLSAVFNRERGTLDLLGLLLADLQREGVKRENIDILDYCTACDRENFFSYRRDGTTGRHLSFIKLL